VILVDSTKYISWMRAGLNPVTMLELPLRGGLVMSCGIVRIEVLRGMIKLEAKTQIETLFETIPEVPLGRSVIADATESAWAMDRKGRILPVTDLLIAACAKHIGATVITEDPHFAHIPGVKHLRNLPRL
jgi:predicted nucleic acid-binding protein